MKYCTGLREQLEELLKGIPLTRCVFLMPFAEILSEAGAPTATLLEKFRLPTAFEEHYDHFVPILPAIEFAAAGQRSQGIVDLGYLAGRRIGFCDLTELLQSAVLQSPTLLAALKKLVKLAPIEDTNLRVWLECDTGTAKVCSTIAGTRGMSHLEFSQWLQNLSIIAIVRQFLGPDWAPATIAFEAQYTPGIETQLQWPNTRFKSGEGSSWFDIPVSRLCRSRCPAVADHTPIMIGEDVDDSSDIVNMLKLMLPTYVTGRIPTVAEIAEMAGTSTRSLQRRLARSDLTYSKLIDQARYEVAAKMLVDSETKIIDAAYAAGYSDPAHLTRAFRRIAGMTPREYRRNAG